MVVEYPYSNKPYLLDCDASADGLGSILSQENGRQERVVAYYRVSRLERNYCVVQRELLAIVKVLDYFHPYLYGA